MNPEKPEKGCSIEQLEKIFATPGSLAAFLREVSQSPEFKAERAKAEAGPHISYRLLWHYAEDTLDNDEMERVMDHLAWCRKCSDTASWFMRLQRRMAEIKKRLSFPFHYLGENNAGFPNMVTLTSRLANELFRQPVLGLPGATECLPDTRERSARDSEQEFALSCLGFMTYSQPFERHSVRLRPERKRALPKQPPVELNFTTEPPYPAGKTITIEVNCLLEGNVWVLCHGVEPQQTSLLFPNRPSHKVAVRRGQSKRFRAVVPDSPGRYRAIAVWSTELLLDTKYLDFSNPIEIQQAVAEILFFMQQRGRKTWHTVEKELLVI